MRTLEKPRLRNEPFGEWVDEGREGEPVDVSRYGYEGKRTLRFVQTPR